jgi:hypothetical protein
LNDYDEIKENIKVTPKGTSYLGRPILRLENQSQEIGTEMGYENQYDKKAWCCTKDNKNSHHLSYKNDHK